MPDNYCEKCRIGKLILEDQQYVCNNCGEVSKDFVFAEPSQNLTRVLAEGNLVSCFDLGLSTIVDKSGKDACGKKIGGVTIKKLVDSAQKVKICNASQKNKLRAFLEIQRLCKILNLAEVVKIETKKLYTQLSGKKIFKNRNLYACLAALIYTTASGKNLPITLNDVLKVTQISRRSFYRAYHLICVNFAQAPDLTAPIGTFLERYFAVIPENEFKEKLIDKTIEHLDKLDYKKEKGRSAITIAVTVIYNNLVAFPAITQESFLKKVSINKSTCENVWRLISNRLEK